MTAGVLLSAADLAAQSRSEGLRIGTVTVSGSLRSRAEMWNWFQGDADGDYTFSGSLARVRLSDSKQAYMWQLEVAVPFVLSLPDTAIAPSPQGQAGLGAAYFAANDAEVNAAAFFVKQASIRFDRIGGRQGHSLMIGRTEFSDGAEVAPRLPILGALKRDRVAQRLIGPFGFTHVGRSFDGAQWALTSGSSNMTLFAGRPTQGVFQVDGSGELAINLAYGAFTRQQDQAEWRVFGFAYQDLRDDVIKTDNRPLQARRADAGDVVIETFGGHYIRAVSTRTGSVDVLLWGALQTGMWGALAHRAGAFAAEAGWQPAALERLSPWIRGGFDYGSGDGDPNDETHGTFFQGLSTPRLYARFPFFNGMNTSDAFGEIILRPSRRFIVRSDIHDLRLTRRSDLWYSGGGAFQPETFGFAGRPADTGSSLATVWDISGDCAASEHVGFSGYFGYASGGASVRTAYPAGRSARFGYLEVLLRF